LLARLKNTALQNALPACQQAGYKNIENGLSASKTAEIPS